ncbi:MAG: hypothetical protein GXP49_15860 [Deltaproteobacteria bacterium]|nr:hypothetical protein [Deltaproteobacteria bacterium]
MRVFRKGTGTLRNLTAVVIIMTFSAFAPGCSDTTGKGDSDVDTDTDTDTDAWVLAWLGDLQRTAKPGDSLTLKVALIDPNNGPVSNEEIVVGLIGGFLDAKLDSTTVVTGDTGVAEVQLTAASSATSFQIKASHDKAESVAITIRVKQTAKQIVLIGDSQVTIPVNQSRKLTAKLIDADTRLPIPSETLTFSFDQNFNNTGNAALDGQDNSAKETNGLGRVEVVLSSGTDENTFNVHVSTPGAEEKVFKIVVTKSGQTQTCRYDNDCENGQFCENGVCKDRNTDCTDDLDCAFGEKCDNGKCISDCDPNLSDCCVLDSDCPDGQYCDNGSCSDLGAECSTNDDCWNKYGDDYVCRNGVCTELSLYKTDLSGDWDVQSLWYPDQLLDKTTRLNLEKIFDVVKQIESYMNLDPIRQIPVVGDMIADWIRSMIPEEIVRVVEGANDAIAAFKELQVHSTMTLSQRNPPATPPNCKAGPAAALIRGKDAWWGITIWWRGACPTVMDCAPSNPQYPRCPCAEVELDLEDMNVHVLSSQFDGCVERRDQPALDMLVLKEHDVHLNWGAVMRYILEKVILDALAGVDNFEDFFAMVIDCDGVASWADGTCQQFNFSCYNQVKSACQAGLNAAASALRGYLDGLDTGLNDMTYSGNARIVDEDHDQEADKLGPPDPPAEDFGTGRWSGEIIQKKDANGNPIEKNQFSAKWRGVR